MLVLPANSYNMLLSVSNLRKEFLVSPGLGRRPVPVQVLKGVNLDVRKGEIIGILGDSGSGKTTFSRIILRLMEPTSGRVFYEGRDIFGFSGPEVLLWRKKVQIVLQNPFRSLPPHLRVGDILREVIRWHKIRPRSEENAFIAELLRLVQLEPDAAHRFPAQFSGGERQRIAIARSLTVQPEFLILDEPTSNLDVSIQAQVINFLTELRNKINLTYLFITHDRQLAAYFCDRLLELQDGELKPVSN